MGNFYRRHDLARLGSCENGTVYGATLQRIGLYEDGRVYDPYNNRLGTYGNGHVYDRNNNPLGSYENGTVYDRNYHPLCTYDGDGAEAAAYFLLTGEEAPGAAYMPEMSQLSIDKGESSGASDDGAGIIGGGGGGLGVMLAPLGGLLLLFCFGLIWWAIYHATGMADLPFLIILVLSIMIGLFLGLAVFKICDLLGLYIETVIVASVINIVASFFTSPGYSIFLIILIPPIVVALASAIPTVLTYFSVRLIRMGIDQARERREKKAQAKAVSNAKPKPQAQHNPQQPKPVQHTQSKPVQQAQRKPPVPAQVQKKPPAQAQATAKPAQSPPRSTPTLDETQALMREMEERLAMRIEAAREAGKP